MAYTVTQLAKISGVSKRTLHWYDKIGLLTPAYHGINNYRYYENEEMLLLQQILFFKELGFKLTDIQKLLSQDNFDKIKALQAHKKILNEDIVHKNNLISTINKTILYLKGKQKMSKEELYHGFDHAKQKEYEQYLVKYRGTAAENLLMESKKRTAKWDKNEWDNVKNEGDLIHKALAKSIDIGLKPDCDKVQKIIHQHYQLQGRFYELTKEIYIGLTELYAEHPAFKTLFEKYHPKLIEFLSKAIRFYANKNL